MNNKKGISAIVATVLIILITVAAVTIIWAAIIPMITENLASTDCYKASAALSIVSDYTCYNATGSCTNPSPACQASKAVCEAVAPGCAGLWNTGTLSLQVHRDAGDAEIVGFDVIVGKDGSTNSTRRLSVPGSNGEKVYTVNDNDTKIAAPAEVSLAAVVKSGNTQKAYTAGTAATIVPCA